MDIVSLKNSEKHVGNTYELLVEEVNHKKTDWVSGRLADNHLVHIQGDESLIGTFVNVKITGSKTYYLVGEII
jgi:tRNA-2-methylthio-N6-dimethylallyladenosine synthase